LHCLQRRQQCGPYGGCWLCWSQAYMQGHLLL
jgi:hypothetical protein